MPNPLGLAADLAASAFDLGVRSWVRVLGREVDDERDAWVAGPVVGGPRIGVDFHIRLAEARSLAVRTGEPDAGLLPDFAALAGPGFDPDRIDPRIRDFYEHTARQRLDAWSQWSLPFRPFGYALISIVSRRMQQLNLPISPLETSRGMTSEVIRLVDAATGDAEHICWLRRLASSGDVVYAGFYSIARPPRAPGPCVKTYFPWPRGSVTVLLEPRAEADGSLKLISAGRRFGDPGFYRSATLPDGRRITRYIRAMKELIHVYADEEGILRTEHVFRFFRAPILRLHYKITPKSATESA